MSDELSVSDFFGVRKLGTHTNSGSGVAEVLQNLSIRERAEPAKLTFADLPDDLLYKIFDFAKIGPFGFPLRLDKRTEMRIHSLIKEIRFRVFTHVCMLILNSWVKSFNKNDLVENIGAAILALCQFNTDKLIIEYKKPEQLFRRREWHKKFKKFKPPSFYFSEHDFATLLVMSANIREVVINLVCSSLEAMDLCIIWKTLTEGDCKLESFSALMYSRASETGSLTINQIIFSGNMMMVIDDDRIIFRKVTDDEKSNLMNELVEMKMNHVYVRK